jgi:prolipoprotein diacylglyceryltransferase
MTPEYLYILLAGALVCTAAYALRLRRYQLKAWSALPALALSILLGVALAKVFYVLPLISRVWPRYGWASFLRMKESEFSFIGACAGACLGTALSAKLTRQSVARALDAFAPAGALMAAVARAGEYCLGTLGVGQYMENGFFPIAVQNEWGEWFAAVFILEAVLALLCAAGSFLLSRKPSQPAGTAFRRTLFYLALPQIFSESLRAQSMKWGFVRIEQVMCAVVVVALVYIACTLFRAERKPLRRYAPCLYMFISIVVMVGV